MTSNRLSQTVPLFFTKIHDRNRREQACHAYLHQCKTREEQLRLVQQTFQFYESERLRDSTIEEYKWVAVFRLIFTPLDTGDG